MELLVAEVDWVAEDVLVFVRLAEPVDLGIEQGRPLHTGAKHRANHRRQSPAPNTGANHRRQAWWRVPRLEALLRSSLRRSRFEGEENVLL